jgi:HK97 gp10 family phage protein
VNVQWDGSEVAALIQALDDAADEVAPRARRVVTKTGFDTVRGAQALCPVDTGHLRSTIGVDFDADGLGCDVGAYASYAGYVHFGTSRQAPQPFLIPVFDQRTALAMEAFGQIVGTPL